MRPARSWVALLSAWSIAVLVHAWYYVVSILSQPIPDDYAREWDFQLLMFSVFRFPLWLVALAALLWWQSATIRRYESHS